MSIPGKKVVANTAPVSSVSEPAGAAGRAQAPRSPKGTQPEFLLKYAEKGSDGNLGQFQILTGLFAGTTKAGETFYKGTDKNSGVMYVIMPNNKRA